jgi:hypothetical protein
MDCSCAYQARVGSGLGGHRGTHHEAWQPSLAKRLGAANCNCWHRTARVRGRVHVRSEPRRAWWVIPTIPVMAPSRIRCGIRWNRSGVRQTRAAAGAGSTSDSFGAWRVAPPSESRGALGRPWFCRRSTPSGAATRSNRHLSRPDLLAKRPATPAAPPRPRSRPA